MAKNKEGIKKRKKVRRKHAEIRGGGTLALRKKRWEKRGIARTPLIGKKEETFGEVTILREGKKYQKKGKGGAGIPVTQGTKKVNKKGEREKKRRDFETGDLRGTEKKPGKKGNATGEGKTEEKKKPKPRTRKLGGREI